MGRRFGRQERSGADTSTGIGGWRWASPLGIAACLFVAFAIAGCGESASKSASATATTTAAATTTTTPTATSASTSTAANPPAPKPSSMPATKPGKPTKSELGFGKIKITSTAFKAGGPIATKYTCDGAGTSPPLHWQGVPRGASEVFMIAIDLSGSANDAVQWAVAGINPNATDIPEGSLPAGAVAGVNSAGKVGWGGICGAKGQLHRVGFLFYALNHKFNLKAGFNPIEVRSGLKGKAMATGLTLATYQRP